MQGLTFPLLVHLDISSNSLRDFRELPASFPSLRVLQGNKNQIGSLNLSGLSQLRELSLDSCGLSRVPSDLQTCQHLTRISLASNSLNDFPKLKVGPLEQY